DRLRTSNGTRWAVERGEEPIASGVDLVPPVAGEQRPDGAVVLLEELLPTAVAEPRRLLGRADEVREQDGRQNAVEVCLFFGNRGQKRLNGHGERLGVLDPHHDSRPRKPDRACSSKSAGQVPRVLLTRMTCRAGPEEHQ